MATFRAINDDLPLCSTRIVQLGNQPGLVVVSTDTRCQSTAAIVTANQYVVVAINADRIQPVIVCVTPANAETPIWCPNESVSIGKFTNLIITSNSEINRRINRQLDHAALCRSCHVGPVYYPATAVDIANRYGELVNGDIT